MPATGGWQSFVTTPGSQIKIPEGSGTLYFVSLNGGMNVNWAEFNGRGVTDNIRPDVELTVDNEQGFWERGGYHDYGDPWREQRYQGD